MRKSGLLLPISSLDSKYGIGSFSKEAYEFIDKLKFSGQKYWQILPLGQTGFGDSPYQSFSTFAGNPYFIDLSELIENGLLTNEECDECDFGSDDRYIDYEKLYFNRFNLLKKAYDRSNISENNDFIKFCDENKYWLSDYATFMVIKNANDGKSFIEWDLDSRLKKASAIKVYESKFKDEILFYEYLQYLFFNQWFRLKKYANDNGIEIIGDIPIYVSMDSADTWSNPELFELDENNMPVNVAGCPPDSFSKDGQLWGNPLYNWDYHKDTDYRWWISRIEFCTKLYDVVRIDHFRGFDEYYSIPYKDTTARNGIWKKGPSIDLFNKIYEKLHTKNIIAEDLGFLTDTVIKLVKDTGYPSMKVLQFAFDSREDSDYLPHNYDKNSVVYTGTHDNNTLVGWLKTLCEDDKTLLMNYLDVTSFDINDITYKLIRLAESSVSNTCIIPVQDILYLDETARINEPSTVGKNWKWRLLNDELNYSTLEKLAEITKIYGR